MSSADKESVDAAIENAIQTLSSLEDQVQLDLIEDAQRILVEVGKRPRAVGELDGAVWIRWFKGEYSWVTLIMDRNWSTPDVFITPEKCVLFTSRTYPPTVDMIKAEIESPEKFAAKRTGAFLSSKPEDRVTILSSSADRSPLDRPDQLASEIASHLSNDVSGLTAKLGLKPVDYSVEIVQSGLMLVFCDKRGRSISATVCCDGSLKVSIQGSLKVSTQGRQEEHESPDVGLAVPYLRKLLTGESGQEEKKEEESEEFKRRFVHGVHGHAPPDDEIEETPQKSPKIQEEEEEEPEPTQLVQLD